MNSKSFFRKILVGCMMVSLICTQVFLFRTGVFAAENYGQVNFDLIGFATLEGGTTGGTGGKEVTITSLTQANDLLNTRKKEDDTSPLIMKIDGKISGAGKIDIKEVKNISVIGVGTRGELEGIGLNIYKSSNIIVRNLKIHHTLAPLDGIGIESSNHIWVDHCEIYNMIGDCNGDGKIDEKGDISGGDVDWYDGLLDAKKTSEYITVSWNYFHDAFKTSLVGSSDSDDYDRKITFHHNFYENCKSRLPSYRGGTGHIFNNYYLDIESSAVNSRVGAKLRVEGNVFENVGSGSVDDTTGCAEGPIGTYFSDEVGMWDVKDNQFINCKGNQPTTSTCSFTPSYQYSQALSPASSVKAMVTQYAGVGKLEGTASNPPSTMKPTSTPTVKVSPSSSNSNGYSISGYVKPDLNGSSADLRSGFKMEVIGVGSTVTNNNGYFELPNVPQGSSYTVKISKASYLTREIRNVNNASGVMVGPQSSPVLMMAGDINGDNAINMTDIIQIAKAFNASKGGSGYNEAYDLNMDGSVNMTDIIVIAKYFGKTSSDYPQNVTIVPITNPTATPTKVPTSTKAPTPTKASTPTPTSAVSSTPASGDIIIEPNGSVTLAQAIKDIQPGKTIFLKGGTYNLSSTIIIAEGNNGSAAATKNIFAYGSDKPVLDFSAMSEESSNRGIVLAANYWYIKGITIQNAGDNGMLLAGNNNKIEGCLFKKNHDSGLQISRYNSAYKTIDKWPSNNLILDCISTENKDSTLENADGFAAKLTSGNGNVFRNCKALYNCDDGWDLYTKSDTGAIGVVTMENCEASGNGKETNGTATGGDGNGYKLGDDTASVPHVLKNCVANNNLKHGFTGNGNPAVIIMTNCTGSGNGEKLFDRLTNAIFN
ncbi:pectate lyase family protein [Pseudobacteroides cellulosolvens]|uniref:pectate lyase family protein n=1 Tax=Pseudobacteroides cellulosolvens TaxID=35825 RepID=UPI000B293C89|nr:right-handed parallel beta-helix repeat-containing protein [Pseudobacteroides cellulosolvens]